MSLTLILGLRISAAAGIRSASPGQRFFFGGFDLGFSEGLAVFAGGFGAEALG
jgi:hypothetical protein